MFYFTRSLLHMDLSSSLKSTMTTFLASPKRGQGVGGWRRGGWMKLGCLVSTRSLFRFVCKTRYLIKEHDVNIK